MENRGSKYKDTETAGSSTSKNDDIVFRVVDGLPAKLGQLPYQVSLKYPIQRYVYKDLCGGSVIGKKSILTAANCVTQDGNICENMCKKFKIKSLMKMYVVAGTIRNYARYQRDDQGTEQWRKITDVSIPAGFWFTYNDIGVAKINFPFVFNDYVQPLPFASRVVDYEDIQCVVSGFGRIGVEKYSDILLWKKVRLLPNFRCSALNYRNMDKYICTSEVAGEHYEPGTTGCPLVCQNTGDNNDEGKGVIVGVMSGVTLNYRTNRFHSLFTRVSIFSSFVRRNGAAVTMPVSLTVLLPQIISRFS